MLCRKLAHGVPAGFPKHLRTLRRDLAALERDYAMVSAILGSRRPPSLSSGIPGTRARSRTPGWWPTSSPTYAR